MNALEWKGQQGGRDASATVVADAKAWEALWRTLGKDAPALDFKTHCAVAAFAGERPTGGFTLDISEPEAKGDDAVVRWTVKEPAPTSFVTQAFTSPWKVKAFPRPKGKVITEPAAK